MISTTELAARFDRERAHLRRVAVRMLGSGDDADDAVQEAWLRLHRTGGEGIVDLRAWLTTVISRICLDMLRARRGRREVAIEIDLDDLLTGAPAAGAPAAGAQRPAVTPEQEVLLAESVGLALHVVMDTLTPAERVAFVLHDIFDLPFDQVAEVLGRSTAAVKMLASRARHRVRIVPESADASEHGDRAAIDAFFAAAGSGDLSALLAVLAPDAELHAFSPRGARVVRGAEKIATQARAGARAGLRSGVVLRPVSVRGAAGMLVLQAERPISVIAFTIRKGLIIEVRSFNDPERLAQIIPSWVA